MMKKPINNAELDFFMNALKEEARTILHEVGSSTDPDTLLKSVLEDLQALSPREQDETRTQEEIWHQVRERLLKAAYATRPHCIRCGTCCSKGSPTLLREDISLVNRDVLKPSEVITIRKGEMSYSNISEEAGVAEQETIKIREVPGTRACIFYQEAGRACTIYESRPAQCRRQECWNAQPTLTANDVPLTRKDVLVDVDELWDVIEQHEQRCSPNEFTRTMARLSATHGQTVEEVLEILSFDHHVREYIIEQLNILPEAADFLFGRALKESLQYYGLKLEEQSDGSFVLSPID